MQDISWPKNEYRALLALWDGSGDKGTNQRAIRYLVEVLGAVNGQSYVKGEPDQTAFNEGRRWVARQLQNALTLPEKAIVEQEQEQDAGISRGSDNPAERSNAGARAAVDAIKQRQRAARALIDSGGR